MHDLISSAVYALLTAIAAAVIASVATSVRLLPEVIDLSIIPTIAGLGSLAFTTYGGLRRFDPIAWHAWRSAAPFSAVLSASSAWCSRCSSM